jgi:hypothetical protein
VREGLCSACLVIHGFNIIFRAGRVRRHAHEPPDLGGLVRVVAWIGQATGRVYTRIESIRSW